MIQTPIALISIIVTLTIFCLGLAYHSGRLAERVDGMVKRLDKFEERLNHFENLLAGGFKELERLITGD